VTLLKDLLYTRNNVSLDIARLSSLLSVLLFWGGVFATIFKGGGFNPVEVGTGCAAIMAGAAGWIHMRQKQEPGGPDGAANV